MFPHAPSRLGVAAVSALAAIVSSAPRPAAANEPAAGTLVEKVYEGPSVELTRLQKEVEEIKRLKDEVAALKRTVEALKREVDRNAARSSTPDPQRTEVSGPPAVRLPENPSRPLIRDLDRFDGHTGSVLAVAVADDGFLGASAGDDGVIRLWDMRRFRDHRLLLPPGGRGHQLLSLAISPDGKLLAAGGAGLFLFRIETGELLHDLKVEGGWTDRVAFSRDGRTLASVGRGVVRLWNPETGDELRSIGLQTDVVNSIDFARDGRILCAGGYAGTSAMPTYFVRLWDPASGSESFRLGYPVRTAFSQAVLIGDDSRILTVGPETSLREWDVATGAEVRVWKERDAECVALSRDRRLVAVGTQGSVELRDAQTGDLLDAVPLPDVHIDSIGLSGDGRRAIYSRFHDIAVRGLPLYPPPTPPAAPTP